MAKENKKVAEVKEETVEMQTTFNEDTVDILYGDDTIIENVEEVKEDE